MAGRGSENNPSHTSFLLLSLFFVFSLFKTSSTDASLSPPPSKPRLLPRRILGCNCSDGEWIYDPTTFRYSRYDHKCEEISRAGIALGVKNALESLSGGGSPGTVISRSSILWNFSKAFVFFLLYEDGSCNNLTFICLNQRALENYWIWQQWWGKLTDFYLVGKQKIEENSMLLYYSLKVSFI